MVSAPCSVFWIRSLSGSVLFYNSGSFRPSVHRLPSSGRCRVFHFLQDSILCCSFCRFGRYHLRSDLQCENSRNPSLIGLFSIRHVAVSVVIVYCKTDHYRPASHIMSGKLRIAEVLANSPAKTADTFVFNSFPPSLDTAGKRQLSGRSLPFTLLPAHNLVSLHHAHITHIVPDQNSNHCHCHNSYNRTHGYIFRLFQFEIGDKQSPW